MTGFVDFHYTKYDDKITLNRPSVVVKNIIMGNMYVEIVGQVTAISSTTKYTCVVEMHERQSE